MRLLDRDGSSQQYRIGLAGRSQGKVDELRRSLSNAESFGVVVANVEDEPSLVRMCAQARVVLDCVGPFRFYGEPVVKACLAGEAHYLDVTGEPDFMERMEMKYFAAAKEKNLVIVSACGFDSVPADIGLLYVRSLFPPPSAPVTVDSFIAVDGGGGDVRANYATFESAVHGFAHVGDLVALRKQRGNVSVPVPGPRPKKQGNFFFAKDVGRYALPFPGSDASVVRRSQQYFASAAASGARGLPAPIHYQAYFTVSSLFWGIMFILFGAVFGIMAKFSFTRSILLKYPRFFSFGVFSHEGPTPEHLQRTTFSITFVARGYSRPPAEGASYPPLDAKVIARLSGPEPGYVATPIFLVESAKCVLDELTKIPRGVLTPASAFHQTSLLERLKAKGIQFKVLLNTLG